MSIAALRYPTLAIEHPIERVVSRTLLFALCLLTVAYVYLIGASTFNIIARKQAELSATKVSGTLSQLNAAYYALSDQVTLAKAAELGLSPIAQKEYVTRTARLGFANAR